MPPEGEQTPTVGRIVHFTSAEGAGPQAAIITAIGKEGTWAVLTVFPPGSPPHPVSAEHGEGPNTWCWPPRV